MTATTAPTDGGGLRRHVAGALRRLVQQAGAAAGDIVFLQLDLSRVFGAEQVGVGGAALQDSLLSTLREVIGTEGTIVVPTYTFSFCRHEDFDPASTPTSGGPWSPSADFLERFRRRPGVLRSRDPIHSVAAEGPAATRLLDGAAASCFGPGSVFARLVDEDALLLMLGVDLDEATIRHHTEEVARAPFRFRKLFTGRIREDGQWRRQGWVYNVRLLADAGFPDGSRLTAKARELAVSRSAAVGRGTATVVRARAFHELTRQLLEADPWATARGPAGDPEVLEAERVGGGIAVPDLPAGASMTSMVDALWRLPRDIVSDGYDAALAALARQVPMVVHRIPSGTECWSWIVPEKWTCHEASLETLDGSQLFSYAEHPLHVVSYSLPYEGEVSREELLRHLHVHPRLHDAVPFVFKYYERDWGLCCSRTQRDALLDDRYRVRIRTSFSAGSVKVGEVVVPGQTDRTVVLCAHLCHPAMVNDDLTGVVVGIDVMRALASGPVPRFTYRFLIVPETIGSVAYLSQRPDLVPTLHGGLFLEMLGRPFPHSLQMSFDGEAEVDLCFRRALRKHDPAGWTVPFRTLAGNDERQFNAPGVRVPMLSLTRQLHPSHPDFPYPEYHSSADTPALVPAGSLETSRDMVLAMLMELEQNRTVGCVVPGEIFCSRYGIHLDFQDDPVGHRALFDVLFLADGTRSAQDIAERCDIPLASVNRVLEELRRNQLLTDGASAP